MKDMLKPFAKSEDANRENYLLHDSNTSIP